MSEHPSLPKLQEALTDIGLGHIPFTYEETFIGYPGGGYWNRQILAAGENFSADLTDKNPYVTAYEIARILPASQMRPPKST